MTMVRSATIAIAALLTVAIDARTECGPTPEKYRDLPFGDTRFAVEENCRQRFTQDEQFFLAGIAQRLRSACKLPRDAEGRVLTGQFTNAAASSLDLHRGVTLRTGRGSAFAAGTSIAEEIRCNGPEAALLARGIVLYLKRTSATSRFVAGCAERYAPRYAEEECRCIANAVRPLFADIDERFFDRELVKESIHRSPAVALTLMFSCGVSEY